VSAAFIAYKVLRLTPLSYVGDDRPDYRVCSEAKDHIEQLSKDKECIVVRSVVCVVAIFCIAATRVCLHDVSMVLMRSRRCSSSRGRSTRLTHVTHVTFSTLLFHRTRRRSWQRRLGISNEDARKNDRWSKSKVWRYIHG
jgi:hypothetical protein